MGTTKNPVCVHACSLYSIKMLFFRAQSFEYTHGCAYILKNKKPVEGRSYLFQRKVPLLTVLTLPPKRCRLSPKIAKKIQKLLKYFKTEKNYKISHWTCLQGRFSTN